MKLKNLSIICATLTCLIFTSNGFAQQQRSFSRKVQGGGVVVKAIQTSDGNYAYLNYANRHPTITKVSDLLGNTISETSLELVGLPCEEIGCGHSLESMAETVDGFVLVGWYRAGYYSS